MNGKPFSSQYAVYPHLRGAYRLRVLARRITPGSSPPMWGIRRCGRSEKTSSRFIPTYVGHTSQTAMTAVATAVHTHLRGAYTSAANDTKKVIGSSPHTWGILSSPSNPFITFRFIPTYVGHTAYLCPLWGSCRFIPTYVGHTNSATRPTWGSSVHPHIRGAYSCSVNGGT